MLAGLFFDESIDICRREEMGLSAENSCGAVLEASASYTVVLLVA